MKPIAENAEKNWGKSTLETLDIASFINIIEENDSSMRPVAFDNCGDAGMRLGAALVFACDGHFSSNATDAATFDAFLKAEQWVLQTNGVRNLVLAYALEESAWRVLARNLNANPSNVAFVTNRMNELRAASPGLEYWKFVASQAWPEAAADNSSVANQPDYLAFSNFANKIVKCAPARVSKHSANIEDSTSIFQRLFISPSNDILILIVSRSVN